jgi:hypothetical protein
LDAVRGISSDFFTVDRKYFAPALSKRTALQLKHPPVGPHRRLADDPVYSGKAFAGLFRAYQGKAGCTRKYCNFSGIQRRYSVILLKKDSGELSRDKIALRMFLEIYWKLTGYSLGV